MGVHEAYNRMGLPEIQYVNPLRANTTHSYNAELFLCYISFETDKELEKIGAILKIAKCVQSFEKRNTCRGWEECDGGQAAKILLGQVGFHLIPSRSVCLWGHH